MPTQQTQKTNKDSLEFAAYLIALAKGVKKYGIKHIKKSLQFIDLEESSKGMIRNHIFRYIIEVVINEYGVTEEDIKSKNQRGINIEARDFVIILAKENLSISDIQLGEEMGRARQLIHKIHFEFKKSNREANIDKLFFEKYDKLNSKIENYIQNLQRG